MSIHEDNPLGGMMGKKGKDALLVMPGDDTEEGSGDAMGAASALIDALHAKDAAGVVDAFKALSLHCSEGSDEEAPPSGEMG